MTFMPARRTGTDALEAMDSNASGSCRQILGALVGLISARNGSVPAGWAKD
jgi:hypothetical protein